jgi:hypothetical protein
LRMPDSASFFSCFIIRSFSRVVSSFFLFHLAIQFLIVLCFCLLPSSVTSLSSSPVAFQLLLLCTCLFYSHSILPVALFPAVNRQGRKVGSFLHLPVSLNEWVELCLHYTLCLCGMHRHNFTCNVFLFSSSSLILPPFPFVLPPFFLSFCTFFVFHSQCCATTKWQHKIRCYQLQHTVQSFRFLDSTTSVP